jgi:probable phosphoglycerate mutase
VQTLTLGGGARRAPLMTRLYLVRHGATRLSAEDRFAGSTDVELSDEGRAQAAALGERLRRERITAAYTSPMSRTRETAAIVSAACGLTAEPMDGLREIGHGHWEGMTRHDVEERFSEEYASWEADPFTFAPRGGESGAAVLARALTAVRQILDRRAGERVLVVSHKATIRLVLSSLLGFDPRGYRDRLDQAPACLNVLDFRDPVRARLILFNDISHYASLLPGAHAHLSKWWDNGDANPQRRPGS